jgi:hypothetical protein
MRATTSAALTAIAILTSVGTAFAQDPPSATVTTSVTTTTAPVVVVPADDPTPPAPAVAGSADVAGKGAQPTPDLPAPEGTTTQSPINRPLLITSLVFLGGTYVAAAVDGATSGRQADRNNLLIPVAGPWMDYANRDCGTPGKCNANEGGYKALLVLGGIGQGLGALGIVTSLFLPEKTTRNWYFIGSDTFRAAPSMVGTGYGVGAVGSF